MIRRPPRSTLDRSSAASDVYKRQSVDVNPDAIGKNDVSSVFGHELGHVYGLVKPTAGNATHAGDGSDYNETHSRFDELRHGTKKDPEATYDFALTLYREQGVREPVVN